MIICFSGIDGSGKGTQGGLLAKHLRLKGKRVFESKAYGDREKESFSPFIGQWSQEAILMLFQALHIEQRKDAEAAIARDEIVIADRWDESYLAYHRNFGTLAKNKALRNELNRIAFDGVIPDIGFLIDVPVEIASIRMEERGKDFFDRLSVSYHNTMRKEYLKIAAERKWVIFDGTKSPTKIHNDIIRIVDAIIEPR